MPCETEQLQQIEVGQWLLFKPSDQPAFRAQLVANVDQASIMLFRCRKGPRLFEKRYFDMARALKNGLVEPICNEAIFSDALKEGIRICTQRNAPSQGARLVS